MQINLYKKIFNEYFSSDNFVNNIDKAIKTVVSSRRLIIIGNGGSNAVASHLAEDFQKTANIPALCFSDPALITCFANDYGYDKAIAEWLKRHITDGDCLVAISSSGESKNILNAAAYASLQKVDIISLSGFKNNNTLSNKGIVNFHIPAENYGIVECYHQIIMHIILDEIVNGESNK